MCGIIGIVGAKPVTERLIESLRRLEYRGYDSAGVAATDGETLTIRRAPGKLRNLEAVLRESPSGGCHRHRPHPLGHPRRADRAQRPPSPRRRG